MSESFETERDDERQITSDEEKLLDELGIHGAARRKFLGQTAKFGIGAFALNLLAQEEVLAKIETSPEAVFAPTKIENSVSVKMKINNAETALDVDSRMTLLDALREKLNLTGSKKGCDHGQCGACTVIVDGRRVLSCLTLTAVCEGKNVTTIEGLATGENLHPMQAAFVKYDGFQCGYCTPGQICSAVAMLQEARNGEASFVTNNLRTNAKNLKLSDDEIRERMSGNLCRCGAYPNILKAINEIQTGKESAQTWNFHTPENQNTAEILEVKEDATV